MRFTGKATYDIALGSPKFAFAALWNNGPGAWEANQFCWAITFRRVEDQVW